MHAIGVDLKGTDDAGIQAFKIQHQYVVVQSGLGVEYIAARAGLMMLNCADIRCHSTGSM